MKRIEQILLLLLISTTPIQLGKHFWPQFSFVSGIRVDYLSPTFYLTDIFILLIVALFVMRMIRERNVPRKFLVFLLVLSILSLFSLSGIKEFGSFIYLYSRIISYAVVGLCISRSVDRLLLGKIVWIVAGVSCGVVLVETAQFVSQSSLQGVFYWLGERNFSLSTPGIARFALDGSLILRPYATFPHPNVLAFYLFTSLVLVRYLIAGTSERRIRMVAVVAYVLLFVGLLLTFSRILIFLAIVLVFLGIMKKRFRIVAFSLLLGVFLFFFLERFLPNSITTDLVQRYEHSARLGDYLGKKVIPGVGLNQYFYYQIEVERNLTPYFLQPPHNAYFLVLVQMGVGGLGLLVWWVAVTIKQLLFAPFSREGEMKVILITTLLFASFFDHYFITLHQGFLLSSFVFGLAWSKNA